ncbi:MAG: hypothetical protein R2704_15070 [Microthrixaceae bacterium]
MRPHALSAALAGLRSTYATVVADLDADLDGESETGSVDMEEQHVAARTTLRHADHVLAVGTADLWGVAHLAGVLDDLGRFGVDPTIVSIVVNRAPRSPVRRAEVLRALMRDGDTPPRLTGSRRGSSVGSPDPHAARSPEAPPAGRAATFVPDRRSVESSHRSAAPLPQSVVRPLAALLRTEDASSDTARAEATASSGIAPAHASGDVQR